MRRHSLYSTLLQNDNNTKSFMTMRKMLVLLTAIMAMLTVAAQEKKPIIIPGKGKINVENLRKVYLNKYI